MKDHHGFGARHLENISSQGDDGLEHGFVPPDGDDHQEAQHGDVANPVVGARVGGVYEDFRTPLEAVDLRR